MHTDFALHADGFGRLLLTVRALTPRRLGRLVQRLLEIETYRMTALLGAEYGTVHRGLYRRAAHTTKLYEDARTTVARFLGADRGETIVLHNPFKR